MLFQENAKNLKGITSGGEKMRSIAALSLSHCFFPVFVKFFSKKAD